MTTRTFAPRCLAALAVATTLLIAPQVHAAPTTLGMQGTLRNVAGGPATDGSYIVTVALYKDETGGTALWSEGPLLLTVKQGFFSLTLGEKATLTAQTMAALGATAWVGIKVEPDPELPRERLHSVPFALRASVAEGLDCTGCVTDGALDPKVLAPYAKSASLAKVATSGAFADLTGAPDLGAYAKSVDLAQIATSSDYANLKNAPDLSVFAKISTLAKVATSGNYADLIGAPSLAGFVKTADLDAYAKSSDLGAYAKATDLAAYVKSADLGAYAKTSDLAPYAKTADLAAYAKSADLAGYAKTTDLAVYVKSADLGAYAKTSDLAAYAKSADLVAYAKTADLAAYAKTADLSAYAKLAALAKVATSGAYADLTGAPDLSGFAKTAGLAKVATSGAYADLTGTPDLNVFAKAAALAKVATTGSYLDLKDLPVLAKVGTACGTGLVLQGFAADGSLKCVSATAALPPDGLSDVSNTLMTDVFSDKFASAAVPIAILDNNPTGVSDEITVPDIGAVKQVIVSVDLTNSDISTVEVRLFDPDNVEYLLYSKSGTKGAALKTSWPTPSALVKGDLSTWNGKNPKGKWRLNVTDTGFLNNAKDGQIAAWSLQIQNLSTKKVAVNGALQLVATDPAPLTCDASQLGLMYVSAKDKTLYVCNGTEYFPLPLSVPGSSTTPGVTCKDILTKAPASKDGMYWIDPDGQGGLAQFQVFCDMTTSGGGWTRIDETTNFAYQIYCEGACEKPYAYTLNDAQIDAIKAKSSEARQAWQCHTVGVGTAYDLRFWPKNQVDTYAGCWATNNADEKVASGTETNFANLPQRSWFAEDCGDAGEACQHNVDNAFFR